MRIAPIYTNYYNPKFTSDLGDKLRERLSQGLSGLSNAGEDEFVPASPTQPIIVKEVKIYKKDSNAKETALGIGAGGVGGAGISKLKKGSNNNDSKVDYDKITDESIKETKGTNNDNTDTEITDEVGEEIIETDVQEDDDFGDDGE